MTNTSTDPQDTQTPADETFAWADEPASKGTAAQAREWLGQLQAMIENLATQAGPVIRDVGIKAAELAAVAGEKAGPVAQRAAEATASAGHRIAEKSRDLAAELRRDQAAHAGTEKAESTESPEPIGAASGDSARD